MTTPRPRAVDLASGLLLGLLGLAAVTVVLAIVQRDDLILNWAEGHREAREIVARQGLEYLKTEQPIAIPQFVPVAWVLWVVIASLVLVLLAMFRHGHAWARWVLAALVVLIGIATGAAIRIGAPVGFEVLAWASLLLDVAILAALFRPDVGRYVHAPA